MEELKLQLQQELAELQAKDIDNVDPDSYDDNYEYAFDQGFVNGKIELLQQLISKL